MSEKQLNKTKFDEILDAAEEVNESLKRPKISCKKCGGANYNMRNPIGFPPIRVCTKCGGTCVAGRANLSPLTPDNMTHGQGTSRGPVKGEPHKDKKNQPAYRRGR